MEYLQVLIIVLLAIGNCITAYIGDSNFNKLQDEHTATKATLTHLQKQIVEMKEIINTLKLK